MIARLRVLLPFTIQMPTGTQFATSEEWTSGYRIRVCPPYQAVTNFDKLSGLASNELFGALAPQYPVNKCQTVLVDDAISFEANALQVDFIKDDFDRRPATRAIEEDPNRFWKFGDPSLEQMSLAVNSVIQRLRVVTKAAAIKPIKSDFMSWVLEYLNDDESPLDPQPPMSRRRTAGTFEFSAIPLVPDSWNSATSLASDYRAPIWENLLLDAQYILPDIGASVVLMYSALETVISDCLESRAAESNVLRSFWDWILSRDGDYRKEPSVAERFDHLLKFISGRSLKEETELWQALQRIKRARNTFVHEGKLQLDGSEITVESCRSLIAQTAGIIGWVESLMPAERRRKTFHHQIVITFSKKLLRLDTIQTQGTLGFTISTPGTGREAQE